MRVLLQTLLSSEPGTAPELTRHGEASSGVDPRHAAAYGRLCRPGLVSMLESFDLDATYERGEGDYLWRRLGDESVQVLDLVGGFGANLHGHNHPELVAEAVRRLQDGGPSLVQGSRRSGAAALAQALRERFGDYVVMLTNTGTETVEAALKHAYLERQRPVFWAVQGAFHGKTLGAIQASQGHHQPFSGLGPSVRFLDPDDPADWRAAEAELDSVCGAIVEPIRGEGGVLPLPREFVKWLAATCRRAGVPVIADEIQTGLGRTGTLLESTAIDLDPDMICLSKALGGGLAKIGALLIRRRRLVDSFTRLHTSTFAEDDFSSFVALKALELTERDDLPARCARHGATLLEDLRALQRRHPSVIGAVRGRGLMIGIELADQSDSTSNVLSTLR